MTSYLTLNSLNCNGLNDKLKRLTLFEHLTKSRTAIIFLQETHSKPEVETLWASEWKNGPAFFSSSPTSHSAKGGVAILFNSDNFTIKNIQYPPDGRTISLDASTKTHTFHIVNIYAPTTNHINLKQNNIFFKSIYHLISSKFPTILVGDFNNVEDLVLDREPPIFNRPNPNPMPHICYTFSLLDPFRAHHPKTRKYTHHSTTTQSRIDRFYMSTSIVCKKQKILPCPFSDHDNIFAEITFEGNVQTTKRRSIWRNNVSIYKDPEFTHKLAHSVHHINQRAADVQETWINTKNYVKNLNIKFAKTKASLKTQQLIALNADLTNIKALLEKLPTSNLRTQYFAIKQKVANIYKSEIRNRILATKLSAIYKTGPDKLIYSKLKEKQSMTEINELYDEFSLPCHKIDEIINITSKYYKSLYNLPKPIQNHTFFDNLLPQFPKSLQNSLIGQITKSEIVKTVKQLKKSKSPGPDGLSNELYVTHVETLTPFLLELFNHFLESGNILPDLKKGNITLIHKKGCKSLIQNYRPISLLNADLKIFTRILANRLAPFLPELLSSTQFSQRGRSVIDSGILLRDIYHAKYKEKNPAYLVSLDFKKAFDSIGHNYLIETLAQFNFPSKFIQVIRNLYSNAASTVFVNNHPTPLIPIRNGVRQGDPLSLQLFTLALEPLLTSINATPKIEGLRITGRHFNKFVAFADDLTLTLASPHSVNEALNMVNLFGKASGLTLNQSKTKGLTINPSAFDSSLPTNINWTSEAIQPLNITIGPPRSITDHWNAIYNKAKLEKHNLEKIISTLDHKAVLVNTKVLSQLAITCSIYPTPERILVNLNNLILNYAFGKTPNYLSINALSLPREEGGYNFPNPTLFTNLMYIKPIFSHAKYRQNLTPASIQDLTIEYQIGFSLAKIYQLPLLNSLPHTDTVHPTYRKYVDIIQQYKLGLDDLTTFSIRKLYKKLNTTTDIKQTYWKHIHNNINPNHIKSFNFKLAHDILPTKSTFLQHQMDNNSSCVLCNQPQNYETSNHLFHHCPKIKPLLRLTNTAFNNVTQTNNEIYRTTDHIYMKPPNGTGIFLDIFILLTSLLHHKIWKSRNSIIYEDKPFSTEAIISEISRTLKFRTTYAKMQKSHNYDTLLICSKEFEKQKHLYPNGIT